jgi:UDP-N-acetylglucosamine--dolichyl-phosphate N-acetylglucosaminephosphotransferase
MNLLSAFLVAVLSFLIALPSVIFFSRYNKKHNIVGIDINKEKHVVLPESVGMALLVPIWTFIGAYSVIMEYDFNLVMWGLVVTGFALIGLIDDFKHKFSGKARSWVFRAAAVAILCLFFSYFYFPKALPFGFIIVALYVAGLASFQNTFAGLNGWEVGSGFIISVFISALLFIVGEPFLASRFYLAVVLSASIFALLIFNVYPAKVFPGNSGTLLIGSAIAGLMVISQNMEFIMVSFLFFLPHMIDFALKLFTNPHDMSQQQIMPYRLNRGRIDFPKYPDGRKRYDFAKLLVRLFGPMKEKRIVTIIWIIVSLNAALWLAVYILFFR